MKYSFSRLPGVLRYLFLMAALCGLGLFHAAQAQAQITIAQISDTHLGEPEAPHAFDNLRRTVDMVNARHPDAVIVSGDIGENYDQWLIARGILKWLNAPVYYAPGNHDVHSRDVQRYRDVFGPDYYRFQVKGVTFLVIDSQLLGNFDQFEARTPQPLPPETEAESEKMLAWVAQQGAGNSARNRKRHWWNFSRDRGAQRLIGRDNPNQAGAGQDDQDQAGQPSHVIIGIQHIPAARADNLPPDSKPYWEVSEPYRSRELDLLHKLGVRHMLVGHWHVGTVFERDGIVWHVAPSTGRLLPWSPNLGFAMHTITPDGEVRTEFVPLGN
jgi:3',5'-cyclic AMP phosphodiesterase CpdA